MTRETIAGYDERVTRTPQEERTFREDVRAARERQLLGLLRQTADTGDEGIVAFGKRADLLAALEGLGYVRRVVTPNPFHPGARDRHTFYATDAGIARLAEEK
jgi:hypothetical protein